MGSPLVVDCPRCGRTLKYAGATAQVKAIRCPACSTRINIGARGAVTEEDVADPEQALPKRPPANKPARKKKAKAFSFDRRLISCGIAVFGVLVAIAVWDRVAPGLKKVGAAVADVSGLKALAGVETGPMAWLSDFTQSLIRIRVARLLSSPGWKALPQAAEFEAHLRQLTRIGLDLEEIDSVTLGASGLITSKQISSNNIIVAVIRLTKPVSPEQWKGRITGIGQGTVEERSFQGETIYVRKSARETDAFYFVDSKTIVSSRFDYLERAIPKRGRCGAESRFAGLSSDAAVQVALSPQVVEMTYDYFRGVAADRKPLMVALQADFQSDVSIEVLARFLDSDRAEYARSKINEISSGLESGVTAVLESVKPQQGTGTESLERGGKALVEAIQNSKVSVEDSTFKLALSLPGATFANLATTFSDPAALASLSSLSSGPAGGQQLPIAQPKSIATSTDEFSPIAGSDWQLLSLPEFGVTVETPAVMPLIENITGPGTYRLRSYVLRRPHDSFEVFVTLFPEEIRAKMKQTGRPLDHYLDLFARGDESRIGADDAAQILNRSDARLGPHLGRQATARSGRRFKSVRNFISGDSRWVVEYQYHEGHENTADRDRFFNSLKLLP